jgi:hypothetical protein
MFLQKSPHTAAKINGVTAQLTINRSWHDSKLSTVSTDVSKSFSVDGSTTQSVEHVHNFMSAPRN